MGLGRILTISEVAKLAGWTPKRMRRHLLCLNREMSGMLLQRPKGRKTYTVSLNALQAIAPGWFIDSKSLQSQVSDLQERVDGQQAELSRLRRLVDLHTEVLAKDVA